MSKAKDVYHNDPERQAELDELRAEAKALGIDFHHRAGIPRLKQLLPPSSEGIPSTRVTSPSISTAVCCRQEPRQTGTLRPKSMISTARTSGARSEI